MKAYTASRSPSERSRNGVVRRAAAPPATFLKLPSQERYFGFVHGSTAPSSSDNDGSGMTRSISKSMVLPKPWQRGHAPTGELKLNRIGYGGVNSAPQVLHWNFSLKRTRSGGPDDAAGVSKIASPASR